MSKKLYKEHNLKNSSFYESNSTNTKIFQKSISNIISMFGPAM